MVCLLAGLNSIRTASINRGKCLYVTEWTSSLPYVTLELLSLTFVAVSLNSLSNLKKSDLTLK